MLLSVLTSYVQIHEMALIRNEIKLLLKIRHFPPNKVLLVISEVGVTVRRMTNLYDLKFRPT
jgi:hypothetical protein